MSRTLIVLITAVGVVAAANVGCTDGTAHISPAGDASPDTNGAPDGDSPSTQGQAYHLEAITETARETNLGFSIPVGVELTDRDDEPIADETIAFEIVDSTGDSGVQLTAVNVITDDDGEAINELHVGHSVGHISVHATHQDVADPVEFDIEVSEMPNGDLLVAVDYGDDDIFEVSEVDFHLWETSLVECLFVAAYALPDQPLTDQDFADSVDDEVLFADLDSARNYTVTATAHGPEGQVSAHGCVDEIGIEGDATTQVIVDLELLDLIPGGVYEVFADWDFSEALAASGPVGSAIADALQWAADPGEAAADYMVGLAVDWVCDEYGSTSWQCLAAIGAEAEGSAQDTVADFINDQIANLGILDDIQTLADDLEATVSELTVKSWLTIERKATGEGEVSGHDIWRAIYLYWTQDCDATSPDDCGQIELGVGEDTPYGVLESSWDGSIHSYDQLDIYPHDMVLPYGQIITHVLNQILIPALTGGEANSLSGAFEYLLCDYIGGFSAWGVDFDADTVQDFCTTTFDAVGTLAELYISGLEYDVDLAISGEGRLIDLESDALADVIADGVFYGELEGDDGQPVEIEAQFDGERLE